MRARSGTGAALAAATGTPSSRRSRSAGRAVRRRPAGRRATPVRLADVEAPKLGRLSTGIGEFDRVLGGGLVPGSLVLIGGSPGIGKSTLTASALGNLAARHRVLYVTGRGVARPGQAARRAARARGARGADRGGDGPRRGRGHDRGGAAGGVRGRLGADALRSGPLRRAGLGRTGPGGGHPAHARGEGAGRGHGARRARDQGGRARRAARARAPRGLRARSSRGSASGPTARCARSRTASDRRTRSGCSR